ncbi:hypothetical protein GCM10027288_29850 [Bordetella tumbae]
MGRQLARANRHLSKGCLPLGQQILWHFSPNPQLTNELDEKYLAVTPGFTRDEHPGRGTYAYIRP